MNQNENMIEEIQNTQKMCKLLMESPHYRKMGNEGIYAIVEKAKGLGVSPLDALNGGMYYVRGKVEMTSSMMNMLIRHNKHSVTKDKKSDDTICILHGRRADTGDTWVESFSIEDAKRAGIYANQWLKFPKDMLFARALSRLARQLFPDVIKGVYVQGEISDASPLNQPVEKIDKKVTPDQVNELINRCKEHPKALVFIIENAGDLHDLDQERYVSIMKWIDSPNNEYFKEVSDEAAD